MSTSTTPHWIHDLIQAQIDLKTANSTENIELLNDLKQFFYDEIGSERRLEYIQSFQDLLDVLESRGTFIEKEICRGIDKIQMTTDYNGNNDNECGNLQLFHQNRENIYNFIGNLIGDKWIEFGQQLNINQDILDDLQNSSNYNENGKKIKKMLEIYESGKLNNGQKIVNEICIALTACKCPDISQYVQNVLWR